MQRKRDARGRFVKQEPEKNPLPMNDENDRIHQLTRAYNKIADGGHEPTLQDVRRQLILQEWAWRILGVIIILFLIWVCFKIVG